MFENLAACLHASGRTPAAVPLAHRAVEILRKRVGAGHPDARHAQSNLEVIERAAAPDAAAPGPGQSSVPPVAAA